MPGYVYYSRAYLLLFSIMFCSLLLLELSDKEEDWILQAIASNDSSDLELSDNEADDPFFVAADLAHLSQHSEGRYCSTLLFPMVCESFLIPDVGLSLQIPPAWKKRQT